MQYVAIDFETANTNPNSACAIGLSLFSAEGEHLDSYYSLIKPQYLYFDPRCTAVHGIEAIDILSAPSLDEIWSEIKDFIGKRPLVAHNAPFDIKVLKASCLSAGVGGINNDYYCTLSLSRKMLGGLKSHSLSYIASYYSWVYDAHVASDDAYICGRLFSKLCGKSLLDEDEFSSFITSLYKASASAYPKRITIENTLF